MFIIAKEKSLKYSYVVRKNSKLDIFVGILVSEKTTVNLHFRLNVITSLDETLAPIWRCFADGM